MTHQYKVALWPYQVTFAEGGKNDASLLASSAPFERPVDEEPPLFRIVVDDSFRPKATGERIPMPEVEGIHHEIFLRDGGGYQIRISDEAGRKCALMEANADFTECHVALDGTRSIRAYGLQNALMMTFAFATADRDTLLMHSSVVRKDGYAYLFLGVSGTGKSTHTAHWMEYLDGCDLINDDNPVVRVIDKKVTVFGSPWSGKTPCYRNVQAPVGAFVQLRQAPYNKIERMDTVGAFASLLSSCSVMKWDKRIYGGIVAGVTHMMEAAPTYLLHNLPDREAVDLCYEHIHVG